MFSDLSGYTAMSEKLDPEEVEAIMSRIKVEAVNIVEGHGGMVNQFVGDEVLALFGIPTAHEDDPNRAVRAALQLHGAAGYSRNWPLERMVRDARMFTIGGGTAQVLRTQIASSILGRKLPQTREGYVVEPPAARGPRQVA